MYKKLQQYYIIKTTSKRLKKSKYNIEMSICQARENGEIVSVGESQLIRSLFFLQGKDDISEILNTLTQERRKIKGKRASKENSARLVEIESEIDNILFIPEIVSIVIDNNSQYKHMVEQGFCINNRKFVRLLCGSGQSRRDTVFFIDETIENPLKEILNNGRDRSVEIADAKFNAYFALCASATLPVSDPYFCVIPDYEIEREEEVDFIEEVEGNDDLVVTKKMKLPFNLFDGQGIISPRLAKVWADDLGLDYIPATFVIRNSFMKGMVCVIDFHAFSDEIGKHIIKDAWGNDINIRDMDLVLTTSQFKLWNSYSSCSDYISKCKENNLSWGISKFSPKEDTKHVFSNYQFLQVLNLSDEQIKSICSRTINYFDNALSKDINYALLYLMGKNLNKDFDSEIFNKISDNLSKAMILNNEMFEDPYIREHILKSINKRIRESYIGNLLLDGNYQTMISDPYAFMEHLFGLPVHGLLDRSEHYSQYWNGRNIERVAACRAPLTWRSEVNILNLKKSDISDGWYKYLNSGIIYNVHGYDCMLHADSDMDGDIVMTTSQPEIIEGSYGGNPITYDKNGITKHIIDENSLYKADMKAFKTRIGFITNCSTTLYCMLDSSIYGKQEREEIIERLKICRKEQGNQIDKAKGLVVKPFPIHWTKRTSSGSSLSDRIVINKRPYFMRWLYPNYNRDYRNYKKAKDTLCYDKFGTSLEDFLSRPFEQYDESERYFYSMYLRNNPLLETSCVMNKICHHMEDMVHNIKELIPSKATDNIINLMKGDYTDLQIEDLDDKLKKMRELHDKYRRHKRTLVHFNEDGGEEKYRTMEQYNKAIRQEAYKISSNISELASLAVGISYVLSNGDKGFAWNIFGEGIVNNILGGRQETIQLPFLDVAGNIEYLGSKYSLYVIEVGGSDDYIL